MANLKKFEGKPVTSVGVEMPNAGGGLQDAMKFDPVEMHHDDEVYVAVRATVKKVRFDPIDKGDDAPLRRVHVLHVEEAALIDGEVVEEHLEEQREKIRKERIRIEEEESGQPGMVDADDKVKPELGASRGNDSRDE